MFGACISGRVVLVADVGGSPPLPYSVNAGAGCLAFEMSSGPQRIVVNCGLPASGPDLRLLARSTPAHSTASVADASSCRFLTRTGWWGERQLADWLIRRRGPVVLSGPTSVAAERAEDGDSVMLAARHDGYGPEFGIVHERRWQLFALSARLEGRDAFLRQGKAAGRARMRGHDVAIRFHLHPGIAVRGVPEGLELASALGEIWIFRAENAEIALEESVYFSGLTGPRRTDQIVLHLRVSDDVEVRWSFERLASAPLRGVAPA